MKGNGGRAVAALRMGSKPFRYGISIYRDRNSAYLSPITVEENCRKLRQFADIFEGFADSGGIPSADPRHIDEKGIELFLGHMRARGLSPSTRRTYIKVLRAFLLTFDNSVIDRMKASGKMAVALKGESPMIEFMTQEQLQRVFDAADMLSGYEGVMVRGFFALIFGIAGRPKEVIGAEVDDLDLDNRRFFIRHPKGEGSYGMRQWVPIIREDMIPRLEAFTIERKRALEGKGGEALFLFQPPGENAPYGLKTMRVYKSKVEDLCGFGFKLKSFRSTYATITYQHGGAEVKDAISRQMRHSSTRTTEAYYIAFDAADAAERLKGEWRKSEIVRRKP